MKNSIIILIVLSITLVAISSCTPPISAPDIQTEASDTLEPCHRYYDEAKHAFYRGWWDRSRAASDLYQACLQRRTEILAAR